MKTIDFKKIAEFIKGRVIIYVFGGIGIFLLLISSCSQTDEKEIEVLPPKEDYCKELESKLESILPKIVNVGNVDVMITAKNFGELILAEDGGADGNETIILSQKGGGEDIKVIEEMYPEIQGVIIVAQGGNKSSVKSDLTEAVTALLGVDAHKIKVFERKSDQNDF